MGPNLISMPCPLDLPSMGACVPNLNLDLGKCICNPVTFTHNTLNRWEKASKNIEKGNAKGRFMERLVISASDLLLAAYFSRDCIYFINASNVWVFVGPH